MKKPALLLTGFLGLMLSQAALAEGYFGVNYAVPEQDDRFFNEDRFETGELFLRLGGDINETFSSELRLGTTVSPKEVNDNTFKHNYIAGAFLRADYELNFFKPYIVAGMVVGEESLELASGAESEENFDDVGVGLGVDLQFGQSFGVNLEYTRYYDIGDVMLRGPSAGLYWAF